MSVNIQEIPVFVTYYTKSGILAKKQFGSVSNFGLLLDYFNKNLKNDSIQLKKVYLLNNKEIKDSDLLIDLIQANNLSKKISNVNILIEIEELYNIGDENYPCFKKILQPVRNNFGIYIFFPEYGSMSLEEYPENIKKDYELGKFNIVSAYCNSPNALYISGGIFSEEKLNHFWIIDNQYLSIKQIKMPIPKAHHSMTYVYNNEKEFIFIVGGDDSKTFYYDINNNNFVEWGDMNWIHFHPGLIHIGNYLYCFHLIKDEKQKIFFEKTNLNNEKHIWERVYPNFESETIKNNIINYEFGVSPCAGGRVMLFGGNFNNPNNYIYDINLNIFLYNNNCRDQFIPLIDKNFYKINQNHNIALPASLSRHVEIAIFNKIKYTLRKVSLNFKNNNDNKIIKYKNFHKSNSIGKLNIEFNTEDSNNLQNNKNIIENENGQRVHNNINIINKDKKSVEDIKITNNKKQKKIDNNIDVKQKEQISANERNQIGVKDELKINMNKKSDTNKKQIYSSNGDFEEVEPDTENKNQKKMKILDINEKSKNEKIIENNPNNIYSSNGDFEEVGSEKEKKNQKKTKDLNINIKNNVELINFNIEGDDDKIEFHDADNENMNNNSNQEINNIKEDNNMHIDNENNIVSENEKNADYIIRDNVGGDNQGKEEEIEEITEENNIINDQNELNPEENGYQQNNENEIKEYEDTNSEEMEEIYNDQYYDGNGNVENMQMDVNGEGEEEMVEEEEEEILERDRFELTIVQNIGEDIIQIENYPEFYYDENNFCDYEVEEK